MSQATATWPVRGRNAIAAALRVIWFVAVPALLAALVLRYSLQSPVRTPEGALRELSEWAEAHQAPIAVGFFLLFSGLLRYWRARLPAAAAWAFQAAPSRSGGARSTLLWVGLVALAVVAALVFRGSLFQSYRVTSGSMLPTLQPSDLLLSTQFAYGTRAPWAAQPAVRAPRRGDIVVFRHPPIRPDVPEELVKRVIGLPGDTITTRGGYAFINDWRIPTCNVSSYVFIAGEAMLEAKLRMEFLDDRAYLTAHGPSQPEVREPYQVKPGEVFVLGDNRNNSIDSRAWDEGRGGGLRFEAIRGRVDRVLFGARRNGDWDLKRMLEPIGLHIQTEGIDDSELRAGIDRCLKDRPKVTRPPGAGRVSPSQPL